MDDAPQFGDWEGMRVKFTEIFAKKTRDEWTKIFEHTDACVTPVLSLDEAPEHPHNKHREAFITSNTTGNPEPKPAPNLSRTPAVVAVTQRPNIGEHTYEVLMQLGYTKDDVDRLCREKVVMQSPSTAKL